MGKELDADYDEYDRWREDEIMSVIKIEIDNELLKKARTYVGPLDVNTLVQLAVTTLIQLKAGEWLAAQGGTQPELADIPRRRWGVE